MQKWRCVRDVYHVASVRGEGRMIEEKKVHESCVMGVNGRGKSSGMTQEWYSGGVCVCVC